ncbi:hypothetical protein P5V15_013805 [Pogonomyrmex californicus]
MYKGSSLTYMYSSPYSISSHNSSSEPCTSRILGRRFALTSTAYKYLDIGINVGLVSYVELRIGDNRGNQILLPYIMWKTFIEKRVDIEQLVQSIAPSSLSIHNLIIELVQMQNTNIVKFTLRDTCLYMKPSTVFFLFELEHCVEHVYYSGLYENIYGVSEKFKQFINFLRWNCITDKHIAIKTLRESDIFNKTSIIDYESLAYAIDNIVHYALHDQ